MNKKKTENPQSGIYSRAKTSVVFGGKIGIVLSYAKVGCLDCMLLGELKNNYGAGNLIDKSQELPTKAFVDEAQICLMFPDTKSLDVVIEALNKIRDFKLKRETMNDGKK